MSHESPLVGKEERFRGTDKWYYPGRSEAILVIKWGYLITRLKREGVVLTER